MIMPEQTTVKDSEKSFKYRKPNPDDRQAIASLLKQEPLLASDKPFSPKDATSALQLWTVAEKDDRVVGFVAARPVKDKPSTLFINHIAVDKSLHESGVGEQMIQSLLDRESCDSIKFLETRVASFDDTPHLLLYRLVKQLETRYKHYFEGEDDPVRCRIGPIES